MKRFKLFGAGNQGEESRAVPLETPILPASEWIASRIAEEPYWFHRIELPGGQVTPGWSDPRVDKLPYYGLPEDMSGMRVLDIGNAEGFFSFEAERRGASEVIGLENYPPMARKFEICRAALRSRARTYMGSVYDLNPSTFGTFDLVMFFGVLYHLRHPDTRIAKNFECVHRHCAHANGNLREHDRQTDGRVSSIWHHQWASRQAGT